MKELAEQESFMVVNDQKGETFFDISNPVVGPDGVTVAYRVTHQGKEFVMVGDSKGPVFDKADPLSVSKVTFSPDGSHVAYQVEDNGKKFVMVDDKKGPVFESIYGLTFSPDGKKLGFIARNGTEVWWKVIDV